MIIFVKTLSGKTITLDVADTDTVASIKSKISERESVPVDQQRILYAGKDLEDTKTIAEYSIKKETIIHLVLRASEKNLSSYTTIQKKELEVAQTKSSQYYNPTAGLQDELKTYRDSESKFDAHANPQGGEYDLGKDGEFKEFVVLLGIFVGASLEAPIAALLRKGFKVISTPNEQVFIDNLPNADVAWILSAAYSSSRFPNVGYRRAYDTASKEDFVEAVLRFHKRGGGLFIWGDNDPLYEHANAILPKILNDDSVQLVGNTPGAKTLTLGDGAKTGFFSPHIIFTGVISLYEGVTISYPSNLGCMKVIATSTNAYPVICFADNEALKDDSVGRVMLDCGYTKNYISWDSAGSARYIINSTIWLLGIEHKILHELPIEGKNKNAEILQANLIISENLTVHSANKLENLTHRGRPALQTFSSTSTTTTSTPPSSTPPSSMPPSKSEKRWWKFGK